MTTHLHRAWSRAHASRSGRTIGVMLLSVFALAFTIIATVRTPSGSAAESPDEPSSIIQDFDDDGVDDSLTPDPAGEHGDFTAPGEVHLALTTGFDDATDITVRGETAGDMFGESVATADLTANELADFIIGAPMAEVERHDGVIAEDGAVYVFFSPFQPDANGEVQAADADLRLQSAFGGLDDHFGLRVAPLFDVTGNGLPEIRVRALVREEHVDFIGGVELMHVFAGADSEYAEAGEFLFAIAVNDEFDPWQPLPGDVTGDGAVTQDDIDIILANMGLEGADLTMADGDLNGDGVVNALDLAIALDHLGTQRFDVEWNDGVPRPFSVAGPMPPTWRLPPPFWTPVCTDDPWSLCCCPCGVACGEHQCECGGCCDGLGTGDPCFDGGPCHPDCEDRWCNPACGGGHGECHAQCSGSECNDACDHFDPCNEECGDDGDGGSYGPCHPDCEGWECNPECEGSDPCDEACEDDGGGPCGENCDKRFCNPECDDYDECHENCKPECNPNCGGGPCAEDCDERFCNPVCDDYDECHENCDPECNPNCDEYNPCDPKCDNPPCHSLEECDDDEDHESTIVCADADEPESFCAPDCPLACEDECEPGDWTWSGGSGVTFPNGNTGQCVDVMFEQPGETTLTATNGCCTFTFNIEVECCDACDPDCDAFDPCLEECEDEGYGPCSAECDGSECDPNCEDSNPCAPECDPDPDDCDCDGSYSVATIMYRTFIHCDAIKTTVFGAGMYDYYGGDGRWFDPWLGTARSTQLAHATVNPNSGTGQWGQVTQFFGQTTAYWIASPTTSCPWPWQGTQNYCNWSPNDLPSCTQTAIAGLSGNVLTMTFSRISASEVKVHVKLVGKNPCTQIVTAPAIDADFTIRFRQLCEDGELGQMQYMIDPGGWHDGFPWHELYINDAPIYQHNPCATWDTPNSLLPTPGSWYPIQDGIGGQNLNQWQPVP